MKYNEVNIKNNDDNIDIHKVFEFAYNKHKNQTRDDGTPYINHPIRVAKLIAKYKKSKNKKILVSAALLHDTLEDTYTSTKELYDLFGKDSQVPSLVVELTNAKFVPKLIGKANYLAEKMEHMTSYALAIKLCDILDNTTDLSGCTEEKKNYVRQNARNIIEYLKLHRELTSTHVKIITVIDYNLKQQGY